jgi:hypothetical protein
MSARFVTMTDDWVREVLADPEVRREYEAERARLAALDHYPPAIRAHDAAKLAQIASDRAELEALIEELTLGGGTRDSRSAP